MVSITHRENFIDQGQSILFKVPREVLLDNIVSRLAISEICNLKLTCKSLSVLTDHPLLFKHLLKRDFQKIETLANSKSTYQNFHKIPLYWTKKQDKDDRRGAGMICRIN